MNLHGIVSPFIGAINPFVPATLQTSTGSTQNADYSTTPTYSTQNVMVQVQALSGRDIRQIEGLNLNGTLRSIYMNGVANATVRVSSQGGDLITLTTGPNAGVWLVNMVSEQWPDWVHVIATLQNGS